MIAGQLIFRGWALYPSWFFTDDYRLMYDARAQGLGWDYLTRPFDSQFMPFGRLLVWVVTASGSMNWFLAASLTLLLQALASAACLWMLVSLFGPRWGVLAPLGLYLTSVLTLPALMWWAAGINQIPLQAAFFVAVTAWVRHLRSGRRRWLFLVVGTVAFGLLCYVKALLIVPVLGYVSIAYFAQGNLSDRVVTAVRSWWAQGALALVLVMGYLAYYTTAVPQPFVAKSGSVAAEVADAMLGTSMATGILGGPWRWWRTSPPIVLASPPSWTVHASWVLIALLVLYAALRRHRTLRGWFLLAAYGGALYVLLATSRGQTFGRLAGLEYRYLTDAACVLALVVGLVFLELLDAPDSSQPRSVPLINLGIDRRWVAAVVAVVVLGGLVSSWRYVGYWHRDNASRAYVKTLQSNLSTKGPAPQLAGQTLPDVVMPEYTKPYNSASRFVRLLSPDVTFPSASGRLQVIDEQGRLQPAQIKTAVRSVAGPVDDCGWKVTAPGADIPLEARTFDWHWWLRIGYLGSQDSPIVVTVGENRREALLRRGLHSLYVEVDGVFDSVSLTGLEQGTTVCVDTIEVGDPVPQVVSQG
jgi:hypothetical protein